MTVSECAQNLALCPLRRRSLSIRAEGTVALGNLGAVQSQSPAAPGKRRGCETWKAMGPEEGTPGALGNPASQGLGG